MTRGNKCIKETASPFRFNLMVRPDGEARNDDDPREEVNGKIRIGASRMPLG